MGDTGRDHEVVGLILLEHEPHRADVIAGEAPIPFGFEIPHRQLARYAERDSSRAVRHLASYELESPARGLVVEQHS